MVIHHQSPIDDGKIPLMAMRTFSKSPLESSNFVAEQMNIIF